MNRRSFFTRTAGVIVGASLAPKTMPQYRHIKVGVSLPPIGDEEQLLRMARLLAESARRTQEQIALEVFRNG